MASISATFRNSYSEVRLWLIGDLALDQNAPPVVFRGPLGPGQSTDPLTLYSVDGIHGMVLYQREDDPPKGADVLDGAMVDMS